MWAWMWDSEAECELKWERGSMLAPTKNLMTEEEKSLGQSRRSPYTSGNQSPGEPPEKGTGIKMYKDPR